MKRIPLFLLVALLSVVGCQKDQDNKTTNPTSAAGGGVKFELIPSSQSGVTFNNKIEESVYVNILTYEYFYNGGGVAIGDINNDDLPDIYFTGNQVANRLYLNKGNMRFEDITEQSGTKGLPGWSTGVTMADVNGDGLLDIYICKSGKYEPKDRRNELYINNGDLTFTESAAVYGLNDPAYSTQALFLDYDNDNDLDMYLLNHSIQLFTGQSAKVLKAAKDPYAGDKFFRNDNGKFKDVTEEAGLIRTPLGYGLGVAAGDLNKDGWPDIYVTNDYVEQDYMYINNGDGTFSETVKDATYHTSNFGMGVDIADINNDKWPDIYEADMVAEDNYRQKTNMRAMNPEEFYKAVNMGFHHQYMFNTLQLNNQNMSFSEIAQMANVSNTDWSWATLLEDFNNDGWKDLMVTNGFRKEFSNKDFVNYRNQLTQMVQFEAQQVRLMAVQDMIKRIPETKIANYIFENQKDLTFKDRSADWGFDSLSYSNGASVADLDNDGDLDIVINNIDQEAFIYQNNSAKSNKSLRIKMKGPKGNTSGIGAKVEIEVGENSQFKEHYLTRGYQSSIEDRVHFGLGDAKVVDKLTVVWPDGKQQVLSNIKADEKLVLDYAKAESGSGERLSKVVAQYFQDITSESALQYTHQENNFYDFAKEILLPHKMSQFGPAMAIGDVNGDNLDDIFLGGAIGFSGKIFIQNENGTFSEEKNNVFNKDQQSEDVGAAFLDADGDGDLDLYVASGGNEYGEGSKYLQDRLYFNRGKGKFRKTTQRLPTLTGSGAVVKPFDYDADGDLDLFVGGRLVPQKYPTPANSYLLRNEKGKFKDVTKTIFPDLQPIGLVTDAEWTDVNANDAIDLVIVGEWMPIKVFEFSNGKFEDLTEELDLEEQTGWWYSVTVDDIDKDGDMDILAGNLGLNYKYKASASEPFQVYYNDFDNNGSGDIVLGYFNDGELFPLRGRQCSSDQMPFIKEKFKSYDEFGKASLEDIYGSKALDASINYKAYTFASTILRNDNNAGFSPVALPKLAQLSSVNEILVRDIDQDGQKDLILTGNLYPVEIETIRNDASVGMVLKGKGNLTFEALSPAKSGFFTPGDVKYASILKLAGEQTAIVVAKNADDVQILKFK